jgi:hypothetical protein
MNVERRISIKIMNGRNEISQDNLNLVFRYGIFDQNVLDNGGL